MSSTIYKICTASLWREAERAGLFLGAPLDRQDGYIHFSAADQVAATAAKHFTGMHDLVLVAVDAEFAWADAEMGNSARSAHCFRISSASMPLSSALWVKPLPLDPSGRHVFPDLDGSERRT